MKTRDGAKDGATVKSQDQAVMYAQRLKKVQDEIHSADDNFILSHGNDDGVFRIDHNNIDYDLAIEDPVIET